MTKEMAKLTEAPTDNGPRSLRDKIDAWFDGTVEIPAPVHDFWSLFEMLLLAKTKRLSRFVTAANVAWQQEVRKVDSLTLAWMPFVGDRQDLFGPSPWKVGDLRRIFAAHPEIHPEAQADIRHYLATYRFNRDEPITLIQKPDEQFLLDGNGRLYAAFMAGKTEISCWTGYMADEPLRDYWVSTGLQRRMCYDILENEKSDPELSRAVLLQLQRQLRDNRVARVNYDAKVRKRFPQLDDVVSPA